MLFLILKIAQKRPAESEIDNPKPAKQIKIANWEPVPQPLPAPAPVATKAEEQKLAPPAFMPSKKKRVFEESDSGSDIDGIFDKAAKEAPKGVLVQPKPMGTLSKSANVTSYRC